MTDVHAFNDRDGDPDLGAAKAGDRLAFDRLIAPYRRELLAHCYRMLGSIHDADDALQDTLLRAWRGLPRFAGRSSLRTWLYRIATNACLAMIHRKERGHVPVDPTEAGAGPAVLEPFPDPVEDASSPATAIERRESMESALVAAVQYLPAKERAVLLLRDVLGFSANETAVVLDTSVAAVTSRLQRARNRVGSHLPDRSQRVTLRALGDDRLRRLVTAYVDAWERGDADAIVALVTEDATFSMPPEPTWLRGRRQIRDFLLAAPLRYDWRLIAIEVAGQLAFACYTPDGDSWVAHSVDVLALRGDRIERITAFNDPGMVSMLGLPTRLPR
jgi:RNA polymerase sigma-70 factor, ECF subfamily